jgi:hypothetical protein
MPNGRSQNSIIILINYFGQWPEWINLFIESCKLNPDINWTIYTDCGEPENKAANVTCRHITFDAYCELVSRQLGIKFHPDFSYKLCDIRPALGVIHRRDIVGYRFWGYGDLDVIYGNIRSVYSDDLLERYDVISSHEKLLAGHFSIFRNTWILRNAFRRIPKWRESMTSPEHAHFDEGQFSRLFWKLGPPPGFWKHINLTLNPYCRRALFREQYSTTLIDMPWLDGTRSHPDTWFWRDGRITNDRDGDRQFLYLHFMNWKSPRNIIPFPEDGKAAWEKIDKVLKVDWREACRSGFCIGPSGISSIA